MAKGNMLLGYSRGSVGDVTFYRDGGEQRARARNRKPNNPRSNRQMYQRAKFAGAVKFFKQSMATFYRMAFENKKPNESDYNAFMRVNLAQSPLMSKTAFDKPGYPAIGHWTIAQGSMPTMRFETGYGAQQDALAVVLPVKTTETISETSTIGEFSQILINSGLYMQGDIFTLVRIVVVADSATLATLPTATPTGNWNTYWTVNQILLNTADTRQLQDEFLNVAANEHIGKDEDGYIYISNTGDNGFSLVTTRNTANGLKASNSEIVVDSTIETAITTAQGDDYKNAVLADWRANGENILQGALANSFPAPLITQMKVSFTGPGLDKEVILSPGQQTFTLSSSAANVYVIVNGENLPTISQSNINVSGYQFTAENTLDMDTQQLLEIDTVNAFEHGVITITYAGNTYVLDVVTP